MYREIITGDTFRILGTNDLWVATYLEGSYNLLKINSSGWIELTSPKFFNGFDTMEGLQNKLDGGFIYVGNVYRDDSFVKNYL
jgi:hypothetical protein